MQRLPPSERIRQQISELLQNGLESQDDPLGTLMQVSAQLVVQEALESQTTEQLGSGYHERRDSDEPLKGYRNG